MSVRAFLPACIALQLLGSLFGVIVYGQSAPGDLHGVTRSALSFETQSTLILVPVTVTDRSGALVSGLRADAFKIFEGKVAQGIFSFSEEDAPASIGVIFDLSGSMKGTLDSSKIALRSFLQMANPGDEAFLYTVSTRPNRDSVFTRDLESLSNRLALSDAEGSTALIDTIYCGLTQMRSARYARKALLIISDGMDNHSRYTEQELTMKALEADVQIYTISMFDPPAYEKPIQLHDERHGLFFLEALAAKTGGLHFVSRNEEDVTRAAVTVGRVLRNQYVIGYVPHDVSRDGKWHPIQVRLNLPRMKAYARSGYYSE